MRSLTLTLLLAACSSREPDPGGGDASVDTASDAPTDVPQADGGFDTTLPPVAPAVTWPRDAIFYHLYIRSFADSDGDGKGDFAGLRGKLDYIKSLGVDGVLLLPVFEDAYPESGGYVPVDHLHAARDYGGDAEFDALIKAAHANGLKVAIDMPLSLASDTHPWFVEARKNRAARNHFYVATGCPKTKPLFGGENGWYPFGDGDCYFSNWGAALPNVNYRDPETIATMLDVAASWLSRGVDGFRLDSAAEIVPVDPASPPPERQSSGPAVLDFWQRFMARSKAVAPQSFAVAELFDKHADYYARGVDMGYEIPMWVGLDDAWQKKSKKLLEVVVSAAVASRSSSRSTGAVFLGNHDWPQEAAPLDPRPAGRTPDLLCPLPCGDSVALTSAAMLLFSLPGTPFIWAGEEIGLHGAKRPYASDRAWGRNPMQWNATANKGFTTGTPWTPLSDDPTSVAAQEGVKGSLLDTYRGLIKTRRTSPALMHGSYRALGTDRDDVYAFLREAEGQKILVVASFADADVTAKIDLSSVGAATPIEYIFKGALTPVTTANASAYPLAMAPRSALWIELR